MLRPALDGAQYVALVQIKKNNVSAEFSLVWTATCATGGGLVVLTQTLKAVLQILLIYLKVKHVRTLLAKSIRAHDVETGALLFQVQRLKQVKDLSGILKFFLTKLKNFILS